MTPTVETKKDTDKVTLDRVYPQTPDKVWRALTSRRALERWLLPNDFQPRLGHRFTFRDKHRRIDCEVIALEEGARLAYTWREGDEPLSVVSWTLEPVESGTRVRLRHQPCVNVAATSRMTAFAGAKRWSAAVETLGAVLEPLRQVFRAPSMQRGAVHIRTSERRRTRINIY